MLKSSFSKNADRRFHHFVKKKQCVFLNQKQGHEVNILRASHPTSIYQSFVAVSQHTSCLQKNNSVNDLNVWKPFLK